MWWVFSRSIRLDDGCRLWHLITVSGATEDVIEVVVTAGLVRVVETVTLCVCTVFGSKFAVTVIVLGNESDSVSCGKSALLSSCVSEYNPVISYWDSCRLNKHKKDCSVSAFVKLLFLLPLVRLFISWFIYYKFILKCLEIPAFLIICRSSE